MKLPVKRWTKDSILPKIAHKGDAGADCYIRCFKKPIIENGQKKLIEIDTNSYGLKPLERIGCSLGFATAIPNGYYASVVPRSGNALWKGLSIVNTPGTIDSGYRNEWMAIIINLSNEEVVIEKGEKICQLIIHKMIDFDLEKTADLEKSERGLNGFGSTGVNLNNK